MNEAEQKRALQCTERAARLAGKIIRANLRTPKTVNETTAHDIKLQLDVECQRLIATSLHKNFPDLALLGEEGVAGDKNADHRWVVDPIDGTVNFAYEIPHAAVSIALQERTRKARATADRPQGYQTILGVVYDPFLDELWSATEHEPARLNGTEIAVSQRRKLGDAMVAMGFGKDLSTMNGSLRSFIALSQTCRKVRNMGSAALALVYVACGRFDAYLERGISLWDIAAGGFIVERAGGHFWREPLEDTLKFRMITSNGRLYRRLRPIFTGKA